MTHHALAAAWCVIEDSTHPTMACVQRIGEALKTRRCIMKWEGHQESENVEDRRGLGKKGLAIGGGGALIVLLIAGFLGIDPQKLNQFLGNPQADPRGGDNPVE